MIRFVYSCVHLALQLVPDRVEGPIGEAIEVSQVPLGQARYPGAMTHSHIRGTWNL